MISGAHTAPLARTVANSTIITPNNRKFQLASKWMCRAIGSAGLSGPMNRLSTVRTASVRTTINPPVISRDWTIPMRVIWPTRSHLAAPMFCETIALTAAPSAIAGIWT